MPAIPLSVQKIPLVAGPTPVSLLAHTSARLGCTVRVKHDDRSASRYGGNKPRKLEYLLADARAQNANAIVTVGAYGSHHVLASAVHGRDHGFEVHAVVVPQACTSHVIANVRRGLHHGAHYHPVSGPLAAWWAVGTVRRALEREGKRPYVIAPGGSSPVGTLGYVDGGRELAEQIARGETPLPDAIFVALGSGGTAAGIALGLALSELRVPVIGVRVTAPWMMNGLFLGSLLERTAWRLEPDRRAAKALAQRASAQLRIDRLELGRGYGIPTDRAKAAKVMAHEDGVELDDTYTAKAFAAIVRRAEELRGKEILFWHTLSSIDPTPELETAPEAPEWVRST